MEVSHLYNQSVLEQAWPHLAPFVFFGYLGVAPAPMACQSIS